MNQEFHVKRLKHNLIVIWAMLKENSDNEGLAKVLVIPFFLLALLLVVVVFMFTVTDTVIIFLEYIFNKAKGK